MNGPRGGVHFSGELRGAPGASPDHGPLLCTLHVVVPGAGAGVRWERESLARRSRCMGMVPPSVSGLPAKRRPRWLRWSWYRRRTRVLLIVVAVLVALRLAAPHALEYAINDRLRRIPDYSGRVTDVDINLWRGAYTLEGLEIRKDGGAIGAPLFSARRVDFSMAWRKLWHRQIVSDIVVRHAQLTLVRGPTEQATQMDSDRRWQDVIQDVFPIEITHLEISDGDVHFVDQTQSPEIDFSLHDVGVVATGLRNRKSTGDSNELPAAVNVQATTVGDGRLRLSLRIAPLEPQPLFDLDAQVEHVSLPALNSLLRAYANVDVSRGSFEMYLEVAARDGAFRGYVKPFFRDLDFENLTDRERPLLGRIWESFVNLMDDVLKNPERRKLGTRVPFAGDFTGTEVGTWTGIVNAVRNGFGAAFSEAIEGRIQPDDVANP